MKLFSKKSHSTFSEAWVRNLSIKHSAICLTVLLLSACGGHKAKEQVPVELPTVKVESAAASREPQTRFRMLTGTIRPVESARIAARVTGTIIEFPVYLGKKVEAGEILGRLSAKEITFQLQQAQGSLDKARRDLMREEKLLAEGASTTETVNDLRDQVRILEAAVEEAQTHVTYTTLRAPFAGVVTAKLANEGDLATPGFPLLTLENPDRLRVETHVPEVLAERLAVGTNLTVELGRSREATQALIVEIAPVADARSRSLLVKLDLPSAEAARPGQFARVRIPGPPVAMVSIPVEALERWGQIERVFVIENGRARLRVVKAGQQMEGRVDILAGLEGTETLVVNPPQDLRDGQPVE